MKTLNTYIGLLMLLAKSGLAENTEITRDDLVAHEWGTLTAVVGSDGNEVPWWTPKLEGPATLPEFVHMQPQFTKSGGPLLLRMETPVIYFYAERDAKLKVSVDESKLNVTEVYPRGVMRAPSALPGSPLREVSWDIEIRPPSDQIGRSVPTVGERGAHYGHAREVPDAWWVVRSGEKVKSEVEKFIFYRGAGTLTMPRRISSVRDKQVQIMGHWQKVFLVEVGERGLSWKLASAETAADSEKKTSISYPWVDPSASRSEEDLASALSNALSAAGLTADEARAMVKTWREAWLGERGLRVLEILPRAWVDSVLPLRITPTPKRVERVFMARWELLSSELEDQVLAVMEDTNSIESKSAHLHALGLGRFRSVAVERAAVLRDRRFRIQAWEIASHLNIGAGESKKD